MSADLIQLFGVAGVVYLVALFFAADGGKIVFLTLASIAGVFVTYVLVSHVFDIGWRGFGIMLLILVLPAFCYFADHLPRRT